jgi:arsenate reductase
MADRKNVLFLCTGNSVRSILAEGLLGHLGGDRFSAFSAGSEPAGTPHPAALSILADQGIDAGFARSKSWDEFAGPQAPQMDLIITVCTNAAGEVCPIWPGHPHSAHWGIDDPAAVTEPAAAVAAAFAAAFDRMYRRVGALLVLGNGPVADQMDAIRAIGDME